MIDIAWLVENGPCLKFTAGNAIPCPGGPEPSKRAMYILLAGGVDVHKKSVVGGTHIVSSLQSGDFFGGREYFTDANDCTYIAGIDSVVYAISEESFSDLSWSRPEIVFEMLRAAYMPPRKKTAVSRSTQQKKAQTAAKTPPAAPSSAPPAEPPAASAAVPPATPAAAVPASPTGPGTDKAQTAAPTEALIVAPTEALTVVPPEALTVAPKAAPKAAPIAAQTTEIPASSPEVKTGFFPQGHKSYPNITRPEYLKLVFPKDYTCPFCKATFKDYRVFRSKLYESAPMRYDLRKFFTGFQTEWYDVLTCQSCLFSTFHNYFTEPKPMQKVKIEKKLISAREYIHMDFSVERDIDFVFTAHYIAILCSTCYPSIGKQILAKLWGNLSWLYEDVEDKEMEKLAAGKAAEAYEQVYTQSRLTPVQEQVTCLSIAGMQHRAGVDTNLKKFIFTAKTQVAGDKTYAKLAEDFMYDLKMDDDSE